MSSLTTLLLHVLTAISVVDGLDIRDNSDQSVGSRKPIASRYAKKETLPKSSIVLTMSEAQLELH